MSEARVEFNTIWLLIQTGFQLVSHHVICDGHWLVVYEPRLVSRYSSPDSKQSAWAWCVQSVGGSGWWREVMYCVTQPRTSGDARTRGLRQLQAPGSGRDQPRADTRDWQAVTGVNRGTPPPLFFIQTSWEGGCLACSVLCSVWAVSMCLKEIAQLVFQLSSKYQDVSQSQLMF